MPDCNLDLKLGELLNKKIEILQAQLALVKAKTLNDLANEGPNILGDTVDNLLNTAAGELLTGISELADKNGITNIAAGISIILTSGKVSYLALAAFLFSLLRLDLQRRVIISEILYDDLEKLLTLINILLNSKAFQQNNKTMDNLSDAYGHIINAYVAIGESHDQLSNLNYYDPRKITKADTELTYAENELETPVADAIQKWIKSFLKPDKEKKEEEPIFTTLPSYPPGYDNVLNDVKKYSKNNYKLKEEWAERKKKAAKSKKRFDIMLNGFKEYFGFANPITIYAEQTKILTDITHDMTKYMPLRLGILAGASIKAAKAIAEKPTDAIAETTELLKEVLSSITLLDLNKTIKTKMGFLSTFSELFNNTTLLTSALTPLMNKVYKLIEELEGEMYEYIDRPPTTTTATFPMIPPTKNINTQMMWSIKMSVWKQKINVIQKYLDSLKTPGEQLFAVGTSFTYLKALEANFQSIKEEHADDNSGTPACKLAYTQLNDLLKETVRSIFKKKGLLTIRNKVAESKLSLKTLISQDNDIIQDIIRFTNSVYAINGIPQAIELCDKVLDKDSTKYNKPIKILITEIRNGNLALMMNAAQAAISQVTGLISGETREMDVSLDLALTATGSIYHCIKKPLTKKDKKKLVDSAELTRQNEDEKKEVVIATETGLEETLKETNNNIKNLENPPIVEDPISIEEIKEIKETIPEKSIENPMFIKTIEEFIPPTPPWL